MSGHEEIGADNTSMELVDVAATGTASQSSLSDYSRPDGAQAAVGGIASGDFAIHTETEENPWWSLDLGSWYPVESIVVRNRKDPRYRARARTLRVEVSERGDEWTLLHAGLVHFGVDDDTCLRIPLAGQVLVRYVKISLDETAPLHLTRVEVLVSRQSLLARRVLESVGVQFSQPARFSDGRLRPETYRVHNLMPNGTSTPSGLRVIREGRFANNVLQMVQAIEVARKYGLGFVQMFESEHFDFSRSAPIQQPRILSSSAPRPESVTVEGDFFYPDRIAPALGRSTSYSPDVVAGAREWLVPYLDLPGGGESVASDELLVHIRTGDLFGERPHPRYGQPPLAFYVAAIERALELDFKQVRIIAEDRLNPVINALEAHLLAVGVPSSSQIGQSLGHDLATLIAGRGLVFGRGTFGLAICMLSSNVRVVFEATGSRAYPLMFPSMEHLVSANIAEAGYGPFRHWDGSPEQRAEMLTYPREALQLVEHR